MLLIRKLTEERFKRQMTGDQTYPLVLIGIGTAGRELRVRRKEPGKVKKMI